MSPFQTLLNLKINLISYFTFIFILHFQMPNYKLGKIYKIISKDSNLIYIGSTISSLKKRMNEHRCNMLAYLKDENYNRKQDSWKLLIFEDAEIKLIEKYPCSSKRELEERERYYIENVGLDWVVNERLPAANKEIRRKRNNELRKIAREKNKDTINRQNRERYANDEEYRKRIQEIGKQRRTDFKAEKAQSDKKYRENNREKVLDNKKRLHYWIKSWGGDYRYNNNLLQIKI